jgi:hypothetical protein
MALAYPERRVVRLTAHHLRYGCLSGEASEPVQGDEMKKKELKKLALHRETLTDLDRLDLHQVAGGITLRCTYSGYNTCNTCQATCTTNYC